jgi:ABC-type polysaccharide/polyol phosphate transport system ATPase subunit
VKDARLLFDRVWKKFHRGQIHDSLRDLIPAVANRLIGRGASDKELSSGDFWAVRDLSFEVRAGQTLGIIGPNGCGKSTTLKMLTRIIAPSRGYCEARGRVGTLIEVSAGFHGDLTGRENVFLQGAIMGMPAADITRKFDQIVDFSGIAEAIDTPVKRYSSGMNARLGFSIAAHLEPDILIIDEVLAVGDMSFQERAFGRIKDLADSGIPVIMVSHQLDRIAEMCTDCILLDHGQVVTRGTANEAIAAYVQSHDKSRMVESTGVVMFDTLRLEGDGIVRSGGRFNLRIAGRTSEAFGDHVEPILVRVRSLRTGSLIFVTGSKWQGFSLAGPGPFNVCLELQANLPPGSYMIEVAAEDLNIHEDIASAASVMLQVTDARTFAGHIQLNAGFKVIEG